MRPLILAMSMACLACSSKEEIATTPAGPGSVVLLRERKLSTLLSGIGHYEASGVTVVNGELRMIFDDASVVAAVSLDLTKGSLGPGPIDDSQFEAITAGNHLLFVAKEAAKGLIEVFDENGVFLREEATDLTFADANKALEGLAYLDETHLLAMGEKDAGKLSVLVKAGDSWKTESTFLVPVTFADYADVGLLARADGSFTMAVVSQESAKLWVGHLLTAPYRIEETGSVYAFESKYCELEGVAFIDETTLAMVSDKSSKSACEGEAESVHVFAIR